jgi:putative flippase GtrA
MFAPTLHMLGRVEIGRRTWRGRLGRYALGSLGAVLVSALAFALAYGPLGLGPRLASLTAFLAGALVNFTANRFWAWDRRGRARLGRDVLGYVLLALTMAGAAAAVTSAAHAWLRDAEPGQRAVLVEAAYFGTYGALFLVRFVLLDRLVFRSRHQVPSTTRAYRAP